MPAGSTVRPQKWSDVIDLYDDGEYSAIWGTYENSSSRRLGVRWNDVQNDPSELGYPNMRGYPLWYAEPEWLTNGLRIGTYYIIRGKFIGQSGKTIQINDNDFNGTSGQYWIFFDVDYMVRYSRGTVLNVLLTVNQSTYGSIQYVCVEIIEER